MCSFSFCTGVENSTPARAWPRRRAAPDRPDGVPAAFAEYAETFARRYPWIRPYTPVNEMLVTAEYSALRGCWNEQLAHDRSFVSALTHVVGANRRACASPARSMRCRKERSVSRRAGVAGAPIGQAQLVESGIVNLMRFSAHSCIRAHDSEAQALEDFARGASGDWAAEARRARALLDGAGCPAIRPVWPWNRCGCRPACPA